MAGKGGRPKGGGSISVTTGKMPVFEAPEGLLNMESEQQVEDRIRGKIEEMLTKNLDNLSIWLEEIGNSDPLKAMQLFKDFTEYVLPKKQRDGGGGDTQQPVILNFAPASKMTNEEKQKLNQTDNNDEYNELFGDD